MTILAAQYLESVPPGLTAQQAIACLRRAFDILPLSYILLGWNVPAEIEAAVAAETARYGARLFQWHPLLTGESDTPLAWRTRNLRGEAIPGHHNMPEFTFICPNHPEVQTFIAARAAKVVQRGVYQGLFLDRIRFPSPAASPENFLGCFCEHCRQSAEKAGFDLEEARSQLAALLHKSNGSSALTQSLFRRFSEPASVLDIFLRFRADSITRCVASISEQLSAAGMDTSLDCFSPSLTWMVGQDLSALDKVSVWTKAMIYPHTYGPAGMPFELLGLLDWLHERKIDKALDLLRACSGLDLPQTRASLARRGLSPSVIQSEIELGREMGVTKLLAGLALVILPGISSVNLADLAACRAADGIVLSWDLWHISPAVLSAI